ncbi:MAG: 6-bladed beta-propeller [Desulfuromonadales bacterium]|nr:MAG: 6-bladed beta-propeller [Desulfuromonadales bacterium]
MIFAPRLVSLLFLLLVLALLAGCAGFGGDAMPLRDPTVNLVWPPHPNPPRIRFLREITGPDQIMPQQGTLKQFWHLVTGESRSALPFASPYGISSDGSSLIYAADTTAGVVHRYDLARREASFIAQAGNDFLASPAGVAVGADGTLYVSDSINAKIYVFDRHGTFLRELGDGKVSFKRPAGLAVDSRGDVFVVDVLAHSLYVFNVNGVPLGKFPREGSGEPLNLPTNVAIDRNDNVYVSDSMNFTIKMYDRDGNYIRRFGEIGDSPGSFARPRGVAVDSDLHVYVIDATFDNFQIFDQEGHLLLFVGKPGKRPGEFFLPSGIYIDRNDRIFITDTFNKRIQVFQYLKQGVQ